MTDYPKLMKKYPDQVQCILIRDTQGTEPVSIHSSFWGLQTQANIPSDGLAYTYDKRFRRLIT